MGIGIADFNRDGLMDVFISNDTEPNFLYLNKGGRQVRRIGDGLRRGLQRPGCDRFGNGLRREGLRQRRLGRRLLQQPPAPDIRAVPQRVRQVLRVPQRAGERREPQPQLFGLEQRVRRLRQRRMEGHLFVERRCRLLLDECRPARHDVAERDGKSFVDVSENLGKDFLQGRVSAGLGCRRS